ncbi:MAG TPA: hypothetical protein VEY09_16260 [Pyrinomonadaceae bacterium]|nr:hypothetical protein [Pyrinomonadaceae bacterium]
MNTIEKIKAKLQKYPLVKCESNRNSISVMPTSDSGFIVSLYVNPGSFTISFNGWHEDFPHEEEALNWFALGLSSDCRLKEYRRGNFAYKWVVEYKENGGWVEGTTTGLFLFPFWVKRDVRYLQNDLFGGENDASGGAI